MEQNCQIAGATMAHNCQIVGTRMVHNYQIWTTVGLVQAIGLLPLMMAVMIGDYEIPKDLYKVSSFVSYIKLSAVLAPLIRRFSHYI